MVSFNMFLCSLYFLYIRHPFTFKLSDYVIAVSGIQLDFILLNNYIICVLIIKYNQFPFTVITDIFVLISIILFCASYLLLIFSLLSVLSFHLLYWVFYILSFPICLEIIHSIFNLLVIILQFSTFRVECWDEYIYLPNNIRTLDF